MSIASNIAEIRKNIPKHVQLVCVSKFHSNDDIMQAYNVGERVFGESKVQEMCAKYESLPKDIKWHFIGHLQSNKVKYIVPFVDLIHGVDSIKLLAEIEKQAAKIGRKQQCLLQIHIAKEDTKFGFSVDEILNSFKDEGFQKLQYAEIVGVMGMATFSNDTDLVRSEFDLLKAVFEQLKTECFANNERFHIVSMGMSDDYQLAIAQGSTMVRIGSSIFGVRNY